MTTLTTLHPTSFIASSPCGEADWLDELQAKSRRIMVVDGSTCAVNYAILNDWKAAQQLVQALLNPAGTDTRQRPISELEAEVIGQTVIEERAEVVILVGSQPSALRRWVGIDPVGMINCRTHVPVLAYGT